MPLEHGDPVFTPERGFTVQLRGTIADTMAPRAFAALADGSYRLNAHDFIAHVSPDHLQLHTADDPEGVTIQMHKWGRGGDLHPLLKASSPASVTRPTVASTSSKPSAGSSSSGSTAVLEHGWTIAGRPDGDELLGFELKIDAAQADVSIDAQRAWIESDGGTTWNVTGLEAWDAEGRALELWMEPSRDGLMVRVDDTDAAYPITVDPWYTTTSTEIQNTTTTSSRTKSYSGNIYDRGRCGYRCNWSNPGSTHAGNWTGSATIANSGNSSVLTSDWAFTSTDFRYGTLVRGIGDTNGDDVDEYCRIPHVATGLF